MIHKSALRTITTGQSRGARVMSIFVSILLAKIERAFLERVDVAHHQNGDEAEHAPENGAAVCDRFLVNDRPWIHEHDLEIEKDEQHRHKVELHAEAWLSFALRDHPAFVRSIFCRRVAPGFAEQHADENRGYSESDCDNDLQENRQIFSNHSRSSRIPLITLPSRDEDPEGVRFAEQSPLPGKKEDLCISCHSFSPRRARPDSAIFRKHADGAFPRLRWRRSARGDSRAQYQTVP